MRVSGLILAILICAALLVSGVSAMNVEKSTGYTVNPATNLRLPLVITPLITGGITQGQTVWQTKVVSSGTTTMFVDLNWGNNANSLTLTVFAPDGTLGPYYDSSDGITNGRIYLMISKSPSLTPGTWSFRIYGDRITGTQNYSFAAN
ncbi:MAG: peptidase domain-containing protein [Methanoregula sp.]